MNFSRTYPTTLQTNSCNALKLAPSAFAVKLTQTNPVANARACGDDFNVCDFADDLEIHTRRSRRSTVFRRSPVLYRLSSLAA